MRPILFAFISLGIAFAMVFTPFGRMPFVWQIGVGFTYMSVFFHELGHSAFFWLLGYPSLPRFDFQYGGGFTHAPFGFIWLVQMAVWGGLAWLANALRPFGKFWVITTIAVLIFSIAVTLTGTANTVTIFMGHGSEALVGSFLLMRGFWNILLTRRWERWLNVSIGGFMIFSLLRFAWQLSHDHATRFDYLRQKGQEGAGDITRIAEFIDGTMGGVCLFLIAYTIFCVIAFQLLPFILPRDDDASWHDDHMGYDDRHENSLVEDISVQK